MRIYLFLHYCVGQALCLEGTPSKQEWLIGINLFLIFPGGKTWSVGFIWMVFLVTALSKVSPRFYSRPLVRHFLCDSCKWVSYIRKIPKTLFSKAALVKFIYFKTTVQIMLPWVGLTKREEEEKNWKKSVKCMHVLRKLGNGKEIFLTTIFGNIDSYKEVD